MLRESASCLHAQTSACTCRLVPLRSAPLTPLRSSHAAPLLSRRSATLTPLRSSLLPLQVLNQQIGDEKSDIWALGCVLYEMVTLSHAFNATSAIQRAEYAPLPDHVPHEIRELLERMLQLEPAHRPSIDELLASPALVSCAAEMPSPVLLEGSHAMMIYGADGASAKAAASAASATSPGSAVWAKQPVDGMWHRGVVHSTVDNDCCFVHFVERSSVQLVWHDGIRAMPRSPSGGSGHTSRAESSSASNSSMMHARDAARDDRHSDRHHSTGSSHTAGTWRDDASYRDSGRDSGRLVSLPDTIGDGRRGEDRHASGVTRSRGGRQERTSGLSLVRWSEELSSNEGDGPDEQQAHDQQAHEQQARGGGRSAPLRVSEGDYARGSNVRVSRTSSATQRSSFGQGLVSDLGSSRTGSLDGVARGGAGALSGAHFGDGEHPAHVHAHPRESPLRGGSIDERGSLRDERGSLRSLDGAVSDTGGRTPRRGDASSRAREPSSSSRACVIL